MEEKANKPSKAATAKKSETVKKPAAAKAVNAGGEATKEAKAKAPAKSSKTAVPEKAMATVTRIDVNRESVPASRSLIGISAEEVARLAHQYWLERGCQHGRDAEDWFRAEQALRSKAS
jgi:hypothetical protein